MGSLYLRHPASLRHDTGGHPENADRIRAIEAELSDAGWLGLDVVEAPEASREQLARVHTPMHIDSIAELAEGGGGMIDMDTVMSEDSYEAALHAAGGAVHAVDHMLGGGGRFSFCGLRPPGHHAESARAMGFCLFNNVAVAAAHALEAHAAERVLVIDWDVHHGNGTEAIFYESDQVMYSSLHQSPLYPGTGDASDAGRGRGEGFTVNVPLPPGSGSEEFLGGLTRQILPRALEWKPRLVCISAGYDAHRDDPLADCMLDESGYSAMSTAVREVAAELDAPVLVCLEGGYNLDALAASVRATIEALAE